MNPHIDARFKMLDEALGFARRLAEEIRHLLRHDHHHHHDPRPGGALTIQFGTPRTRTPDMTTTDPGFNKPTSPGTPASTPTSSPARQAFIAQRAAVGKAAGPRSAVAGGVMDNTQEIPCSLATTDGSALPTFDSMPVWAVTDPVTQQPSSLFTLTPDPAFPNDGDTQIVKSVSGAPNGAANLDVTATVNGAPWSGHSTVSIGLPGPTPGTLQINMGPARPRT
jgi:hypothetical protein